MENKKKKKEEMLQYCTKVLTNGTRCNTILLKITPIYEKIAIIKCPKCGKIYDFIKKYEIVEENN